MWREEKGERKKKNERERDAEESVGNAAVAASDTAVGLARIGEKHHGMQVKKWRLCCVRDVGKLMRGRVTHD